MGTITGTLPRGLKTLKDKVETLHAAVVLRESTVGDLLAATDEAEKCVLTPDGHKLIASPTLVTVGVLRRQVVSIGEIQGPLSLLELRKLHPEDLGELQRLAAQLDGAAGQEEIPDRGRDSGTSG